MWIPAWLLIPLALIVFGVLGSASRRREQRSPLYQEEFDDFPHHQSEGRMTEDEVRDLFPPSRSDSTKDSMIRGSTRAVLIKFGLLFALNAFLLLFLHDSPTLSPSNNLGVGIVFALNMLFLIGVDVWENG